MARACVHIEPSSSEKPRSVALDADKYRLNEAEHQRIFENRVARRIFVGAKAVDRPVAVIFGGAPGSGKSAAVDAARDEQVGRGGVVEIIGDDLRGLHPRYDELMARDDRTAAFHTDRDTGRWVEKTIAYAEDRRVNLIIEGTMRDSDKVAETMRSLREAGYQIDARAVVVNDKVSWQGVIQRYEMQKEVRGSGRMTAPHSRRAAADGMPLTMGRIEDEKLAERVSVYRRGGVRLYGNEIRRGDWHLVPSVRAVIDEERNRPMTLQERRDYLDGFDEPARRLARPERRATPDEFRVMDELRSEARRALQAEVLREVEAAEAVRQHPELAGAFGVVAAIAQRAEIDGLDEQQQAVVVARARESVAVSIERGETVDIQFRMEVDRDRGRDKDVER